jgi:RNA recognition motif-containing protein
MNKKLYVGNLSYTTTEDELHRMFAEIGPVTSASLITDRQTGQSKGFGFVEMETAEAAQKAIEQLNNTMVNDRALTVNEARPRETSSFGGGGGRDSGGNRGGFNRGGGSSRDSGRRRY